MNFEDMLKELNNGKKFALGCWNITKYIYLDKAENIVWSVDKYGDKYGRKLEEFKEEFKDLNGWLYFGGQNNYIEEDEEDEDEMLKEYQIITGLNIISDNGQAAIIYNTKNKNYYIAITNDYAGVSLLKISEYTVECLKKDILKSCGDKETYKIEQDLTHCSEELHLKIYEYCNKEGREN